MQPYPKKNPVQNMIKGGKYEKDGINSVLFVPYVKLKNCQQFSSSRCCSAWARSFMAAGSALQTLRS